MCKGESRVYKCTWFKIANLQAAASHEGDDARDDAKEGTNGQDKPCKRVILGMVPKPILPYVHSIAVIYSAVAIAHLVEVQRDIKVVKLSCVHGAVECACASAKGDQRRADSCYVKGRGSVSGHSSSGAVVWAVG